MAIGDAAAAAGMSLVNGATVDARDIDTEINRTRDYIAQFAPAIIPIGKGGTGATTAANARTALGIPVFTTNNTPDTIMLRGSTGLSNIATPISGGTQVANKAYVDTSVLGAIRLIQQLQDRIETLEARAR